VTHKPRDGKSHEPENCEDNEIAQIHGADNWSRSGERMKPAA
jgi:hypothetical protein